MILAPGIIRRRGVVMMEMAFRFFCPIHLSNTLVSEFLRPTPFFVADAQNSLHLLLTFFAPIHPFQIFLLV